ncbi:TPA: hypothetical protein HA238_03805 [Candidatus Micrarchaeota archaeon]|nr:hypothetical protein [Candidatus Micrarchaeota archaeon]
MNFDMYDHLTYVVNIQVEGIATSGATSSEKLIKRLLKLNARVVVPLPSKFELSRFADKKRLLVGRIGKNFKGTTDASDVFDVILVPDDKSNLERFKKSDKRIIIDCSTDHGFGDFGPKCKLDKKNFFGAIVTPDSL